MRTVIVCNCWVSHLQKNIGSMGVSENDWTPKWPFHLPRQLRNDPCENGHLIISPRFKQRNIKLRKHNYRTLMNFEAADFWINPR